MLERLCDVLCENPLTSWEKRIGRAIRIAGCLRSGEGEFSRGPVSYVWVVLVAQRGTSDFKHPSCFAQVDAGSDNAGLQRLRRFSSEFVTVHSGFGISDLGADWAVGEFSFMLPSDIKRVLFICAGLCVPLRNSKIQGYIREYNHMISNASVDVRYPDWIARQREIYMRRSVPECTHLMSIVTPAYKTPAVFLRAMLNSLQSQTYGRWELVVVNASPEDREMRSVFAEFEDPRIRIIELDENRGIAGNTNVGIQYCMGDYILFLDHDDIVEPYALAELVRAIQDNNEPALLYCDEDNVDERDVPMLPLFKPSYNPDLLLSNDYILHWLTVRLDVLNEIERSDSSVNGAQDYDVTFKVLETEPTVVHVPAVLYHWRTHPGSSAEDPSSKLYAQDAGTTAISEHLRRTGQRASTRRGSAFFTYITNFNLPEQLPSLNVLCVGSCSKTLLHSIEQYDELCGSRVHISAIEHLEAGNIRSFLGSGSEGFAVGLLIDGEINLKIDHLLALIADVSRDDVFSVSPKVVRADGLLDFAGAILTPEGLQLKLLRLLPEADGGYVGRSQRPYDACVINPSCCMLRLDAYDVNLLSPHFETWEYALLSEFIHAYFQGFLNVYDPHITVRQNKIKSYFIEESSYAFADAKRLLTSYPVLNGGDPSHNPNFDPFNAYYALNWKAEESGGLHSDCLQFNVGV